MVGNDPPARGDVSHVLLLLSAVGVAAAVGGAIGVAADAAKGDVSKASGAAMTAPSPLITPDGATAFGACGHVAVFPDSTVKVFAVSGPARGGKSRNQNDVHGTNFLTGDTDTTVTRELDVSCGHVSHGNASFAAAVLDSQGSDDLGASGDLSRLVLTLLLADVTKFLVPTRLGPGHITTVANAVLAVLGKIDRTFEGEPFGDLIFVVQGNYLHTNGATIRQNLFESPTQNAELAQARAVLLGKFRSVHVVAMPPYGDDNAAAVARLRELEWGLAATAPATASRRMTHGSWELLFEFAKEVTAQLGEEGGVVDAATAGGATTVETLMKQRADAVYVDVHADLKRAVDGANASGRTATEAAGQVLARAAVAAEKACRPLAEAAGMLTASAAAIVARHAAPHARYAASLVNVWNDTHALQTVNETTTVQTESVTTPISEERESKSCKKILGINGPCKTHKYHVHVANVVTITYENRTRAVLTMHSGRVQTEEWAVVSRWSQTTRANL